MRSPPLLLLLTALMAVLVVHGANVPAGRELRDDVHHKHDPSRAAVEQPASQPAVKTTPSKHPPAKTPADALYSYADANTIVQAYASVCTAGRHAQYFKSALKSEFYNFAQKGKKDGLSVFMKRYVKLFPKDGLVMFDIGAGCYSPDHAFGRDSVLAIEMAKLWGCGNGQLYFAFEPQSTVFIKTHQCLQRALFPELSCVFLENAAFSNETRRMQLRGSNNIASLETHLANARGSYAHGQDVVAWDLTTYTRVHSLAHIDLLKIDTEGHDFAVIEGALPLLQDGNVTVVVMEVSDKMNPDFWRASYGDRKTAEHPGVKEPNVLSVQRYMEKLGYLGFWLGTRHLVPLSGTCWDNAMEICGLPHHLLGNGICWFDIVFILNKGYGRRLLHAALEDIKMAW